MRAVGGFVLAPQLATVTPSHRVTDFFVLSRDLAGACEATTHLSHHITHHRPVRILVSTRLIQPRTRVINRPKPWPATPAGCRKRDVDMDWDPVRRRVQAAVGAQAGWTSFIDAVEEELVDAFLIVPDQARLSCVRSQDQTLAWKAINSPWCDKFPRGSHEMQSWRRKARICKHILTARQRLDESLLGERRTDHTRTVGLVHELLVLARQAHKLAVVPVSLILCARRQPDWMIRIMEAEASGLADQASRLQQQAARRAWRAWLEENTIAGAAKVHQPVGFQAARGSAVDEQLKLRDAWVAVWRASTAEPALAWPEDDGPLFHRPSVGAMRIVLSVPSCGHWAWV